jgi:hypothetical protein
MFCEFHRENIKRHAVARTGWNKSTVSALYPGVRIARKGAKEKERADGAIRFAVASWSPDSDSVVDLAVRRLELSPILSMRIIWVRTSIVARFDQHQVRLESA